MEEKISQILTASADALGIALGTRELSLFAAYQQELDTWNKKINLISVKTGLDIPIKHFIDSLTLVPHIKEKVGRVLDIGSGAGFPGIPLKIALNSLKISLVESSRKKTSFLKQVVRSLGLTDVTIIHSRAEYLMEDDAYRGRFDVVTSRATLKLPQFLRMGAYFLSPKGNLLAMKGKNAEEEMEKAVSFLHNLGLKHVASHDITLPVTGDFRRIIIYEKVQ